MVQGLSNLYLLSEHLAALGEIISPLLSRLFLIVLSLLMNIASVAGQMLQKCFQICLLAAGIPFYQF